jgi:glycosyltransferase involved in cell wall biosynthesis
LVTEYLSQKTDLARQGPGGAETQAVLLSRALAQRGLTVSLVAYANPGMNIPDHDHGVDIVLRPPYDTGGTLRRVREIADLNGVVRASDANVIVAYCSGYWVGLIGLFAKLSRRRFVFASASLGDFEYKTWLTKRRERILYRLGIGLADLIVVQTDEQVELCERYFGRTPVLIKSASEPAELTERRPEAFLWAARVDANKQPFEYLELARALPEAHFWMVARESKGPGEDELWTAVVREARAIPNLELLPPCSRPELMDLMERTVAVVSTSELEGMPNIFLEGWSRGVPALALNHDPDGIIRRLGLGGVADNRRESFAELAAQLWESRDERGACADRCREYVEANHSLEAVGAQWAHAVHVARNGKRA